MSERSPSIRHLLLASVLVAASPALAAEVAPDRLIQADSEPQNWLLNHRTYDGQRYSPLNVINKDNIKGLKLAYAVALGGTMPNENLEATPLAEDGFLYDAPPMTFEVDGKQYVAILSGLSRIARSRRNFTPELNNERNQTMLFVFSE